MANFMRPFKGPWLVTKIIPPSCYEISEKLEKLLIYNLEKKKSEGTRR
jgi:hypothetical protein